MGKKPTSIYVDEAEWNLFKYNSPRLHGKGHNERIREWVAAENAKDAGGEAKVQINFGELEDRRQKTKKTYNEKLKQLTDHRISSDGTTVFDVLCRKAETNKGLTKNLEEALLKMTDYNREKEDPFRKGEVLDFVMLLESAIELETLETEMIRIKRLKQRNNKQKNTEN
jgi:hypothetical protein